MLLTKIKKDKAKRLLKRLEGKIVLKPRPKVVPRPKVGWKQLVSTLKKAIGSTEVVFIDSPTSHTKETIVKPELRTEIKEIVKELDTKEIERLDEEVKNLKRRLEFRGGGSMNRQMLISGIDPLTRYTDVNLKAGNSITITYANNDATRKTDVTISGSASGGGITRLITSVVVDTLALSDVGVDYVYLVSGTTTITLPTAVGNNNLYTIKNVGVGVVTIATTGGQTIDGSLTISLPVQYLSVDLESDSLNWNVT